MMLFSCPSEHYSKDIISEVVHKHVKIRLDSESWQKYTFAHSKRVTYEYSQICLECILSVALLPANIFY